MAILNEETIKTYLGLAHNFDKERLAANPGESAGDSGETKLIFCLADLFKNLDAGRYYGTNQAARPEVDMAERLYYRWRTAEREETERKLARMSRVISQRQNGAAKDAFNVLLYEAKMKELDSERMKLQTYLENTLKENERLDQLCKQQQQREALQTKSTDQFAEAGADRESEARRREPSMVSKPPVASMDSTAKSATMKRGSIFAKLHDEAMTKLEIRQLNEEIRKRREVQYCTFKPEVAPEAGATERESKRDVYERLAQSNRHQKEHYYDAQRQARELQHCTFQPDLPKAKRDPSANRSLELGTTAEVHERLHKEAEALHQARQCKEFAKRERELDGCTFAPSINGSGGVAHISHSASTKRFEELYQDNERKKRQLNKDEVARDERELGTCTFKPSLLTKDKGTPKAKAGDEDEVPRYEKLYVKHSQKQLMLEQKRRELVEEEKKMRQFVALGGKKRAAGTKQANTSAVLPESRNPSGKAGGAAFDRLYSMDKVYRQDKQVLQRKIMKEKGISFTPRTNARPIIFTDQPEGQSVIQRNEEFLRARNSKVARQVPTEMKECTFAPQVRKAKEQSKGEEPGKDVGERLYGYFDVYEKRKAEYRQKHLDS